MAFSRRLGALSSRLLRSSLATIVLIGFCASTGNRCSGQIELLVESNSVAASAWREAQLQAIESQLTNAGGATVSKELEAQQRWLKAWLPGGLDSGPLWKQPVRVAKQKRWEEPILDPNDLAAGLRQKLLGDGVKPTENDTAALRKLLEEHPRDLGVRQLHLHWLDQYVYRKEYADDIAASAAFVQKLLGQAGVEKDVKDRAIAFAMYRRARALAYRELPEVVEKQPLPDADAHAEELMGAAETLFQFAGKGRQEFILLEIRMLRKQAMFGQALVLIEDYGSCVERKWALKKRRDTLADLGWEYPQAEAAAEYRKAFPDSTD
jgi:hypothetical protein